MKIISNEAPNLKITGDELILDIESTGLSPKYASIYMIGIIYKKNDRTIFEQLMAEKKEDEYEILYTILKLIKSKTVITYNGDRFDMNFIKVRAEKYSLDMPEFKSIDLLKLARKVKKVLELPDLKLKTVEKYFGYSREDKFTGGMLIDLYYAYLENKDRRLEKVLLLHNYDDLLGLYKLYLEKDFLVSLAKIKAGKYKNTIKSFKIIDGEFLIEILSNFASDKIIKSENICLNFNENFFIISGRVYKGELKHFFKDYTNYYFLPDEDIAVHKSVGKFLMNSPKEKAKKENAYIKEDGIFLPSPKNSSFLLFRTKYDSDNHYVCLNNIKDMSQIEDYVQVLMTMV